MATCRFCSIADDPQQTVYADDLVAAFLDIRPLFHGHTLVVPREHHVTLDGLPPDLLRPLFVVVQQVQRTLTGPHVEAAGTFVAANNVVSQSVAHLHVHVVPRRPKDGLRGFFWPRTTYEGDELAQWRAKMRIAIAQAEGA